MADDVIREAQPRYPTPMRVGDRFNLNKVSWGAIWAGVMVTIGMEALFLSFGIFIGAVFGGSAIWTMAWYLVTMAVSFYVGAWTAARLSDISIREICILHGVTTWGLATLTTAIIGGVVSTVGLWLRGPSAVAGTAPFTWRGTELYGGIIWGGIILSLIAAYFGGARGLPSPRATAIEPEAPPAPIRRAG